jgi:hypothetical protein
LSLECFCGMCCFADLQNYFMDIINNNALSQLIDQPTHLTNTLDLVLTNRPGKVLGTYHLLLRLLHFLWRLLFGLMSQSILNCPHLRRFFGSRSKHRWYPFLLGSFWPTYLHRLPIRPVHSSTPTRKTGPKTCNQH